MPISALVVGLGFYKLYINGKEVTRGELNTDWTNYAKIIYYDTYNIKPFINQPKNEGVIVELADGWFNPAPLKLFGKYNLERDLNHRWNHRSSLTFILEVCRPRNDHR